MIAFFLKKRLEFSGGFNPSFFNISYDKLDNSIKDNRIPSAA